MGEGVVFFCIIMIGLLMFLAKFSCLREGRCLAVMD